MIRHPIAACFALVALTGCAASDKTVSLTYDAPSTVQSFQADTSLAIGQFKDVRGNGVNWLGAIRGGYGNPVKTLYSEKTVKEVVEDVFLAALKARNLTPSETAPRTLDVTINELNSSQYARREAHVDLLVTVRDSTDNSVLFERTAKADQVNGSVLALNTGIMADPEELRALLDQTLEQAVDDILDDTEFRAALN